MGVEAEAAATPAMSGDARYFALHVLVASSHFSVALQEAGPVAVCATAGSAKATSRALNTSFFIWALHGLWFLPQGDMA
jgi:hypothetical protein